MRSVATKQTVFIRVLIIAGPGVTAPINRDQREITACIYIRSPECTFALSTNDIMNVLSLSIPASTGHVRGVQEDVQLFQLSEQHSGLLGHVQEGRDNTHLLSQLEKIRSSPVIMIILWSDQR